MKKKFFAVVALALVGLLSFGAPVSALAAELEVSGWIPYWRVKEGTRDARRHLDDVDAIFPFAFTVRPNGKLKDEAGLSKSAWKNLFRDARRKDVDVIPTVMWSDGASIHAVLSDEDARERHVKAIVSMVKKGKYDGVDIDYESKWSETRDGFSAFLAELDAELDELGGSKVLSCTIEARTPPEDLYRQVPANLGYVNDFEVIGRVCDRVNVMAYDQQRAVLTLNDARKGQPYSPVADVAWVRKVAELTARSIPRDKIHLGVATYGREYEVTVAPGQYQSYARLWSFNPRYATELADDLRLDVARGNSGEAVLTYFATGTPAVVPSSVRAPAGTPEGLEAAARALAYANQTGVPVTVNFLTWSDAGAVAQKVDLARELGLAGVAIFKIDGGEDAGVWEAL